MKKLIILLLLVSVCFASANGEKIASAEIDFRAEGYINSGYISLRVPYETDYQTIDLTEITQNENGGVIKVSNDFQVDVNVNVDYSQIEISSDEEIGVYDVGFLGRSEKIIPETLEVQKIAGEINSKYILETVREVTEFVYHYISYDSEMIGDDPLNTYEIISKKRGVCVEYAVLSAAILRAKGIPTRYVVGFVKSGNEFEPHGWIEFYTKNYGWLPADPTKNQMVHIDATHVKIGEGEDPTDIFDRINFSGSVADYEKDYVLELKSSKNFEVIESELSAVPKNVGFESYADVNLFVKNPDNSMKFISTLMLHDENINMYGGIVSKIILLNPREEKNFVWKVMTKDIPVSGKTVIHTFKLKSQNLEDETTLHVSENSPVLKYSEIKVSKDHEMMESKIKIFVEVQNTGNDDLEGGITISEEDAEMQMKDVELESGQKRAYEFYFDKQDKLSQKFNIRVRAGKEVFEDQLEVGTGFFLLTTEYLIILFAVLIAVVGLFLGIKAIVK